MKGSLITNAIVALAISYLPNVTLSMPTSSSDVASTFQLNYIGSADGKSFFAEESQSLTWLEASQFCKNSNMQLASITSVAQRDLLKNASNTTFTRSYWTGGRDSQTYSQFAWEFNEVPFNETIIGEIVFRRPIQTCVYYSANPDNRRLITFQCSGTSGILCEIITS